jgi:hypothetical protein
MGLEILERHFGQIGADLKVQLLPTYLGRSRTLNREFDLDVQESGRDELFLLRVREDLQEVLEFSTVNVQPDLRHLLLLVKDPTEPRSDIGKQKFLCGHDERHWFVAHVQNQSRTVAEAMESLKPPVARWAQRQQGVRMKDRNKRHNDGFIRQGEWFFIPRPNFQLPKDSLLLVSEPLQRPGSKAHIVSEVYRIGGEKVYVNNQYPRGLTEAQYVRLIGQKPHLANANWRIMRRNPRVFARGKVRHPDHATITLPFWHEVLMNGEVPSPNVVFLD